MNNRIEPSITPNIEQVDAQRRNAQVSKKAGSSSPSPRANAPKSSALSFLNSLVLYAAIAGGGYWFYQQDIKADQALVAAENRIVELENQLSATGEEMGESTVAMRAKLEALIEKTDKLWSEMDKLWASAWRKNQAQIKELRSVSIKADNKLKAQTASIASNKSSINDLSEKQTAASFNIDALAEQLSQAQSIKTDINSLSGKLASLETKSSSRDKQQIELATMVAELDTSVKMLLERIQRLNTNPLPPSQ